MTLRLRLRSLPVLALCVAACGPAPAADAPPDDGWAGEVLPAPLERPDFTLTDTGGRPYDFLAESEGKVALLFFGYTYCPDVCPVHMANLAAVLDDLPPRVVRDWIEVVFVSTDPERDTPERIRSWLDGFHPGFVGLRGTPAEVHAVEDALGLPRSLVEAGEDDAYFVGHAAQILAFGADGPARHAYPWGTRQRDWLRDLPRLVRETVPGAAEAWPRGLSVPTRPSAPPGG
ncbi:MAG: SCO family protein [Gemmatimonadetes bacterium]|nr:SCO family protein [Gemmatimonadota bacterium]